MTIIPVDSGAGDSFRNNISFSVLTLMSRFKGWVRFAYDFDFAKKIDENYKNLNPRYQWHRGIRLFCQNSPFLFTFSSNYVYVMFTYCMYFFLLWFPFKGNGSQ
jgi:hypothetical protein